MAIPPEISFRVVDSDGKFIILIDGAPAPFATFDENLGLICAVAQTFSPEQWSRLADAIEEMSSSMGTHAESENVMRAIAMIRSNNKKH